MRTIKFKGLRVDGKGWAYGCLLNNGKTSLIAGIKTYEVIPETVGQFTGKLLTSDKVEIYEGDLIKTYMGVIPKEVNWNEKECSWYFGIKPLANLQFLDKIIGNIHDK
jgi:hypothetical protein